MKTTRILSALVVLLVLSLSAPGASAGIQLTKKEIARLARGKTVVRPMERSRTGTTVGGVSFALVKAPPSAVWRVLNDTSRWTEVFPNTFVAKTVAASDEMRAIRMELGNRFFSFSFYLRARFDRAHNELIFDLDRERPRDVTDVQGKLKLIPQSRGRTLLAFTGLVQAPLGGVVTLMGSKGIKSLEKRLLSVPGRLKKAVEKDLKKKKKKKPAAS